MIGDFEDPCSFTPETWSTFLVDGAPVLLCNSHNNQAPCELPPGTDVYGTHADVAAPERGREGKS